MTLQDGPAVDRILEAAVQEFAAHGLDGARVERIANGAGVSKQLIYHYFSNKEDLYSEVIHLLSEQNYTCLLEIDFENLEPRQAVTEFLMALLREYERSPLSVSVTLDQMLHGGAQVRRNPRADRHRTKLLAKLADVLERGQRSGLFNDRVTPMKLHVMAVIVMHGCHSYPPLFGKYAEMNFDDFEKKPGYWEVYSVEFFLDALRA